MKTIKFKECCKNAMLRQKNYDTHEVLKLIDERIHGEYCKDCKLDNKETDCLSCYCINILKELKQKIEGEKLLI